MTDIKERVAAVTGAGGGIGLGIAERLARAGYQVIAIDRDGKVNEAAAALRAAEISAQAILKGTHSGVDGVYTADPKKDPKATKLEKITYQDALVQGLKVVDATAFSLCMDNKMPMRVFGMDEVSAALLGQPVGTAVRA